MSTWQFDWLIDGVSTLLPAAAIALIARRVLRLRLRAVPASAAELQEGPAIVHGRVDGDAPVVATLTQKRVDRIYLDQWYTVWREETDARRVESEPFRLLLADGTPLQVEPGSKVTLDTRYVTAPVKREAPRKGERPAHRQRTLSLSRGESVYVSGTLTRVVEQGGSAGYRDAPAMGFSLRPDARGTMRIRSDAPVFGGRRRLLKNILWIGALAATIGFTRGVLFQRTLALRDRGVVVMATVVNTLHGSHQVCTGGGGRFGGVRRCYTATETTSTIRSDDGRTWETQEPVGEQGYRSAWTIDPLHTEINRPGARQGHDERDLVDAMTIWIAVLLFAGLADVFWTPKPRVSREEREPETTT